MSIFSLVTSFKGLNAITLNFRHKQCFYKLNKNNNDRKFKLGAI